MPHVPYSKVSNTDWTIWQNEDGKYHWDQVRVAVLMDIRQELRKLNQLLACDNFSSIPESLRAIAKNTKRKPKAASTKGHRRR